MAKKLTELEKHILTILAEQPGEPVQGYSSFGDFDRHHHDEFDVAADALIEAGFIFYGTPPYKPGWYITDVGLAALDESVNDVMPGDFVRIKTDARVYGYEVEMVQERGAVGIALEHHNEVKFGKTFFVVFPYPERTTGEVNLIFTQDERALEIVDTGKL